ncbi:GDSL esterase/lipase [Prunus yedoensis var. nudiflora]|uniref:GDSL esterase/lipase n=1 Tax=Prunus yedoensis var. nudiflora TaxID=2094558 RepID=A0A314Y8E8_PRUYE|nr:GDSL esterase/lipase [Prunus yedoensis var. nudiflora]
MSFRNIGEKAGFAWKRLKSMLPLRSGAQISSEEGDRTSGFGLKNWMPNFSGLKNPGMGLGTWAPHLYVNNSDYICCSYTERDGAEVNNADKENVCPTNGQVAAKLFVMSKGNQKFSEAHGLEQWWSNDLELQLAMHNSKLISRQLKSLYSLPAPQQTLAR